MKSLLFLLLLTITVIICPRCTNKNDNSYHYSLQFVTEEYKPFNYTENGVLTGLAPELLSEIANRLNIPNEVQVLPWAEGFQTAQTNEHTVLFSTILNAERKDLFKWAGPFASVDWIFYAASQNPITLNSMDEARQVSRIGVIKDYAIEQDLVNEGFTNLVYVDDNLEAFEKLLLGEIDLFPSDKITAEAALKALNKSIYEVTGELTIKTDLVYFAFNKNIPDDVVADFQREIDVMKTNGLLNALYQKFMQSSGSPEILQVYTEQYPPLTFRNSFGEIVGFGADVVNEIMKRNQTFYDIKLSLWSNGYELALNNPNFCLFTMDRTEIREELFNWVGPIGTNTTFFYTKSGSAIVISTLEDAKNLSHVGTVGSWFSDQYLRDQGFTNLVASDEPQAMVELLMSGQIEAAVCTSVTFADILKSAGYQFTDVIPEYALMSSDFYIAFSKNTDEATVQQWQTALDASKADGTYDAILRKWFP